MNEEEIKIVEAMERYGGSFVKALSACFWRADRKNFIKLKATFPEYWEEYKGFINKRRYA
jgi:pyruvate/2-oxoacid:ferredoxin oxidoreductase beta subunit